MGQKITNESKVTIILEIDWTKCISICLIYAAEGKLIDGNSISPVDTLNSNAFDR